MTNENVIFCDCCDSANVELSAPPPPNAYYMCTMCRDYFKEIFVIVKENNFNEEQVIEYSNNQKL